MMEKFGKRPANKFYDQAEIYFVTGKDKIGIDYVKDGKVIKKIVVDGLEYAASKFSKAVFIFEKFKQDESRKRRS